jgi:hypothetical protein
MVMVFGRSFVLFVQIFNLKGLILPYYKVNRHYFLMHLHMHQPPRCCAHHPPSSKLICHCSTTVDKQQAEATTAYNEQQVNVTMMGITATYDNYNSW